MKQTVLAAFILTSLQAAAQQPSTSDTIPLIINQHNTIYVKAVFNNQDTLNLNFDTGSTELTLTQEVLQKKVKTKPDLYRTAYQLKIGQQEYPTKVYDALLSGQDTDGRFGWDLFKNKVVELNYDKMIMVVHHQMPAAVLTDKTYARLPIQYFEGLFMVKSTMEQDGVTNTNDFLFDTGYQRTAMLDNDLLKAGQFPADKMEVIKKVMMKGGQGNEVPVITAKLDALRIGDYELKHVPVQQITGNKPMKGQNIHILGNEVLKRFNTVLDFQNHQVYLQPNRFFAEGYIESK
jgi:hypothetical protein